MQAHTHTKHKTRATQKAHTFLSHSLFQTACFIHSFVCCACAYSVEYIFSWFDGEKTSANHFKSHSNQQKIHEYCGIVERSQGHIHQMHINSFVFSFPLTVRSFCALSVQLVASHSVSHACFCHSMLAHCNLLAHCKLISSEWKTSKPNTHTHAHTQAHVLHLWLQNNNICI